MLRHRGVFTSVVLSGSGPSALVAPNAAFSFLPFSIYQSGSIFNVGSWDISAQVARSVVRYVNKSGNDTTGDGLTVGTAWKTIGKAHTTLGSTANAVIYVGAGRYGWSDGASLNYAWTVNRSLVATGDVVFDAYLADSGWSLTAGKTNTYQSSYAAAINLVLDYGTLDGNGDPAQYSLQTSVDNVEANAGSFYQTGGVLYVHTLENNTPDSDVRPQYASQSVVRCATSNLSIYLEGIKTYNARVEMANAGAGSVGALYAKNCRFSMFKDVGTAPAAVYIRGYDAYFDTCQFSYSGNQVDLVAGYALNTVIARIVTINSKGWNAGTTGTAYNALTNHNAGVIVDINGEYYGNYGPNIAYTNNGYGWFLGTNSHDCAIGSGTSDANYYIDGTGWLDTCTGSGSSYDFYVVDAGDVAYVRSFTGTANLTGSGAVTAY